MRGRRTEKRDESTEWKAVARETFHAFDLIMTPALHGHDQQSGAQAATAHLERGRQLMQPIIDRYVADARTPLGRAWRTNRVARGAYVQAFAQAIAHASARAAGEPEPGWPILYSRGALPLIHRYTGDRRILNDEEDPR
ncbi:hypothetical protein [Streptomyces sp. P17]|uniref:Uncharacterized protein n=1 Tax=Streptomyces zinciresistens K42 TaxID=700597 RepID=G2G746_9ACTN|nr:hypothetical protein [Streptomyces sp. P17]EGX60587.1 hypothetical protein SZN_06541 [Streptomyces zinciresistens K42]MDT9695943.1 hypothetical protein [Streptomyces sp. P17]